MQIIILAGGRGSRLWPLSKENLPKQFLFFDKEKFSLFQKTLLRFLSLVTLDDITVITNEEYKDLIYTQLQRINANLRIKVIYEPERRNTAPAITLGIKYLQDQKKIDKNESIIIASSDHYIESDEKFIKCIKSSEKIIANNNIVVFGVIPSCPETAYGYIQIEPSELQDVMKVKSFKEKPDAILAQKYFFQKDYLWNCGIFGFSIESYYSEMKKHCKEIYSLCDQSYVEMLNNFSLFPETSIDYALMEKTKNLRVFLLTTTWSDVGSWDSIYDVFPKDDNNNVKIGNVFTVDTKKCLFVGGKRLISTIGLEDIIIIDTDDSLLLIKKGHSQKVKSLEKMISKKIDEIIVG